MMDNITDSLEMHLRITGTMRMHKHPELDAFPILLQFIATTIPESLKKDMEHPSRTNLKLHHNNFTGCLHRVNHEGTAELCLIWSTPHLLSTEC